MQKYASENGLVSNSFAIFFKGFMSSMTCRMPESNYFMDLPPAPHPTQRMNCGELREHNNGLIVEMQGRVNRTRLGRFIELKDQYGVIQLVAPMEVRSFISVFQHICSDSFP